MEGALRGGRASRRPGPSAGLEGPCGRGLCPRPEGPAVGARLPSSAPCVARPAFVPFPGRVRARVYAASAPAMWQCRSPRSVPARDLAFA